MSARARAWWKEPTRDQWSAFLAAWSGWVLDAFDFNVFLLVMPLIARDFGVSMTAVAGSITLTLLVRLLGGVVAGAAADRWGRRLPLMLSIVWFALCDGAVALAPSFAWVLVLRTLFGFGMGAEWTAGTTLAMENWPARSRGIASGILQGSWAVGFLLAGVVYAFVVPRWGWRALFVVAAAPAILVLPIRMWVRESDDWRREARARTVGALRDLLAPGLLRTLLWASVVMGAGFGAYYAMTNLYPTMLLTDLRQSPQTVRNLLVLFNVGMLVGSVIAGTLAARRGVILAVVVPALLSLPLLPVYVGALGTGYLALGAFLGGVLGVGFCGVVPVLLTSLFPAGVRGRAVGFVYHAGAFLAAAVPTGVAALAEHTRLSLPAAIAIATGTCEVLLVVGFLARRRAMAPAAAGAPAARVTSVLTCQPESVA